MEHEDCLFCKIVAGQLPATIEYQDQDVIALRDINPQAKHHILIISKRHIASMDDLTPDDGPLLASIFTVAKNLAHELNLENGYRFLTNVGRDAGQSVAHLHFHLLGGRSFGWPPG